MAKANLESHDLWDAFFHGNGIISDAQRKACSDIAWDCIDYVKEKRKAKDSEKSKAIQESQTTEPKVAETGVDSATEQPEGDNLLNTFAANTGKSLTDAASKVIIPGLGAAALLLGMPVTDRLQAGQT